MNPYPLLCSPVLLEKVWGGDRLARLGKPVRPGARVGESWEVADMAATSASGAGGGAVRTLIANGPLAGKSLREAIAAWGHELLGPVPPASAGGVGEFPLLVKFLDARENLSVQVHPSPAYAAHHPGAHLKTECWYILDALPGSVIYKGVKPGVDRATLARHIADGTVVDDLIAVPAIPGECHNLPSGTLHALGAGVLVAEVQTPSDTTFRVFDWGRAGRELHVAQALECIEFGQAPAVTGYAKPIEGAGAGSGRRLVETEFFSLDEHRLGPADAPALAAGPVCTVVMAIDGTAELGWPGEAAVGLPKGCCVVVPAELAPVCRLRARVGARLLAAGLGG